MSSPENASNCRDCDSKFESIKELDEHRKIHKPDFE